MTAEALAEALDFIDSIVLGKTYDPDVVREAARLRDLAARERLAQLVAAEGV